MSKYTFKLSVKVPQHGVSRRNLDKVLADRQRLDVVCRAIYIGYSAEHAFGLACNLMGGEETHGVIAVSNDLGYSYDRADRTTRVIKII